MLSTTVSLVFALPPADANTLFHHCFELESLGVKKEIDVSLLR